MCICSIPLFFLISFTNIDFNVYFCLWFSRHQHNQNTVNPLVKKVYFFWICPDTNAFEWFTDLLLYLEDRVSSIKTMKV